MLPFVQQSRKRTAMATSTTSPVRRVDLKILVENDHGIMYSEPLKGRTANLYVFRSQNAEKIKTGILKTIEEDQQIPCTNKEPEVIEFDDKTDDAVHITVLFTWD
jgi:hypothetical protein